MRKISKNWLVEISESSICLSVSFFKENETGKAVDKINKIRLQFLCSDTLSLFNLTFAALNNAEIVEIDARPAYIENFSDKKGLFTYGINLERKRDRPTLEDIFSFLESYDQTVLEIKDTIISISPMRSSALVMAMIDSKIASERHNETKHQLNVLTQGQLDLHKKIEKLNEAIALLLLQTPERKVPKTVGATISHRFPASTSHNSSDPHKIYSCGILFFDRCDKTNTEKSMVSELLSKRV